MRRALALARRADDWVSPNPPVGAVLVRGGRVVGEGFHRRLGGAHAEIEAINAAGPRARGATLFVTLEPCNHQGRTPPCVAAILAAGVQRVVCAVLDPNPRVRGGGLAALAAAGIEVGHGEMEREVTQSIQPYLTFVTSHRPFVRWKCASSLDGRIALASGESRWITGEASRRGGQRLRRWADAIIVGVGTVLADDPRLTVRGRVSKPVARVILDSDARTPPSSRLFDHAASIPLLILVSSASRQTRGRVTRLREAGAEVVAVRPRAGEGLDLEDTLALLAKRGLARVLVEGGGRLAASMLRADLFDAVSLFLSPSLLGADAIASVAPLALDSLTDAPRFRFTGLKRLGGDAWLELSRRVDLGDKACSQAS